MLGVVPLLAITPMLIAMSVIDLRSHRIPDRLSIPTFVGALTLIAVLSATAGDPWRGTLGLLGTSLMAGSLGLLHLVRPDGLGRGDVKLGLVLGLVVGWSRSDVLEVGLAIAWSLSLSSAIGLVAVGVQAVRGGDVGRSTAIAFGPALCVGSAAIALAGPVLR